MKATLKEYIKKIFYSFPTYFLEKRIIREAYDRGIIDQTIYIHFVFSNCFILIRIMMEMESILTTLATKQGHSQKPRCVQEELAKSPHRE